VTFAVFTPGLQNDFVYWDDDVNFLRNPHYRGLGWGELRWMFTTTLMGHWIPLTWLTLGLDYVLWGMNPFGYHLTSTLLHAATAATLYVVALRLLARATTGPSAVALRLGAATVALLFALHPLRVESVAWVTERRDVLSGLLFLLTILAYLRASETTGRHRRLWLMGSVTFYALALLAKAVVMTLPAILVLLDVYPLRRLGLRRWPWTAREVRGVWLEKVPFATLALAGAVVALYVALTHAGADVAPLERYGVMTRIGFACFSLTFYLLKTLCPVNLSPLYEPAGTPDAPGGALAPTALDPPLLAGGLVVTAITAAVWLLRRRWPAAVAVWIAYAVLLAPMSGLVQAGNQLTADRYSYLPGLALALGAGGVVVASVQAIQHTGPVRPLILRAAVVAVAGVMVGLGALTWLQLHLWRNTEVLFRHALAVDPRCANCENQLGIVEAMGNRWLPAVAHFERAVALRPDLPGLRGNLSIGLLQVGRSAEAVHHLRVLLERHPGNPEVWNHLGAALLQEGRLQEAAEHLGRAVRASPTNATALSNLGIALRRLERPVEAIPYLRQAIALDAGASIARFELARAYLAIGNREAAWEQAAALRGIDPRLAEQALR
jgi:Flp pilus assembly protein TadD